jgi:hypothetical protein
MNTPESATAVSFISKKDFGGGIFPRIGAGEILVAYEEGGRVVAIPLSQPFFEPRGVYYVAPIGSAGLISHVATAFDQTDIHSTKLLPGECEAGVWRPGFVAVDATSANPDVMRSDKQSLLLLIMKLYDILLTIEPTQNGLAAYGPRIRELHLLACMEVESSLRLYLTEGMGNRAPERPNTSHYFALKDRLHLGDFNVHFAQYRMLAEVNPFTAWTASHPTQTLPWYDAYNKSKHNRHAESSQSTLHAAIESTSAAIILFAVRYGLRELFSAKDILSSQLGNSIYLTLRETKLTSLYVPRLELQQQVTSQPISFEITSVHHWDAKAFTL